MTIDDSYEKLCNVVEELRAALATKNPAAAELIAALGPRHVNGIETLLRQALRSSADAETRLVLDHTSMAVAELT